MHSFIAIVLIKKSDARRASLLQLEPALIFFIEIVFLLCQRLADLRKLYVILCHIFPAQLFFKLFYGILKLLYLFFELLSVPLQPALLGLFFLLDAPAFCRRQLRLTAACRLCIRYSTLCSIPVSRCVCAFSRRQLLQVLLPDLICCCFFST